MLETHADGAEAAAVADYGDSPESWWQAPLYAYRVKTRQAELRRQLKERQTDLARARQAEEQATVAFADRARHAALKVEAFAQHLEPIATREKLMLERDGALSAEMEAHRARLLVIDDRIAGLSAELAEAKAEERQIEEKLAEAEGIRQRADAKLKRAEIEIRNASSLADAAGAAQRETAKRAGLP
jgi:chromosome segregation ATPase